MTALGNRILKVNHAGEHGAINIYRAQLLTSHWRSRQFVAELQHFLAHEKRHRDIFAKELERRGLRRCVSFHLCGVGGWVLGLLTGIAGKKAIAATSVAVEHVVLRHLEQQLIELAGHDAAAHEAVLAIIEDEKEHHDRSAQLLAEPNLWLRFLMPIVSWSTESVIWLGMRL